MKSLYRMMMIKDIVHVHYGKGLRKADRDERGQYVVWASSGKVGFHNESIYNDETIIIGRKGSVGSIFHAPDGGWTIDTAFYLEPKDEGFIWRYLYYALINANLAQHTITTSIPGISRNDIYATKIPLPPIEEQRRIAAILDKADDLRRKRQESLALMDEFLRSVFLEMFGDPVVNPKGWPTSCLGNLLVDGPQNGLYKASSYYGSGTRIVRIDGFYDGMLTSQDGFKRLELETKEVDKYELRDGDVLINRVNSREYLGKSALVENLTERTVFESNMMRLTLNKDLLDPAFCVAQLQHDFIRNQILNSAKDAVNQSSINQQDVKSFELRLPPLDLQAEYAFMRGRILSQKMRHLETVRQHNNLFNSLVQRAFRGELTGGTT